MISIIITSYKEPKTIGRAIDSFLNQSINSKYELIVAAPDKQTQDVVKKYSKKNKQVKLFKDKGEGKSSALNQLLPKLKSDILILSDGDVYVGENSVNKIFEAFKNQDVGCVSGRPIPQNSQKNLFGYWSHLLCYAANKLREKRDKKGEFLECSGYLWAFRNNIIKKFPVDIAEDTIVPILFWLKNWKVKYAKEAEVYVKFPSNLNEFIKQKRRAIASHGALSKYIPPRKIPRMKTFFNEISGSFLILAFPKNFNGILYAFFLFPIRLYVWLNFFYNAKIKKRSYSDKWKRIKSTK